MDTYEILSTVRNFSGLETEDQIGTNLLKRLTNLGMQLVGQTLMSLYHEFLVKTLSYSTITADSIDLPNDVLRIIDINREDSDSLMRLCTKVPVEDKGLVGKNANYQASEHYPMYVHEGRIATIYPTLSAADVDLRYRKRVVDMVEGDFTYVSNATGYLGADAIPTDDVYNQYDFAIYTKEATALTLLGVYKCTDYAGSNKLVTLDTAALTDVPYHYAIVPIIPDEFHNFIVEAGLIHIKRIKKYADNMGAGSWLQDFEALRQAMGDTLQANIGTWPKRTGEDE